MSDWYNKTSNPADNSPVASNVVRNEFAAVEQGISAKLPPLTGNAAKTVVVNDTGTGLESLPSADVFKAALLAAPSRTYVSSGSYVPFLRATDSFNLYHITIEDFTTDVAGRITSIPGLTTVGALTVGSTSAGFGPLGGCYGGGAVFTNFAAGDGSLAANTIGATNTAVGSLAASSNTEGGNIVAIGTEALKANVTGGDCAAVGAFALNLSLANGNTAVGAMAASRTTSGPNNTAVGTGALLNNITGQGNIAVGNAAGSVGTNGYLNTVVGYGAQGAAGRYNIAVGAGAMSGGGGTGSCNIVFGHYSSFDSVNPVFNVTTESNRVVMGPTSITNAYIQVAWTVVSDERDKYDFATVPLGLDFVCSLQPIAYRFRVSRDTTETHGPVRYGFKAQDVLKSEQDAGGAPVIVDADDPEHLRFNSDSMLAAMANAIRELRNEFNAYKLTHP